MKSPKLVRAVVEAARKAVKHIDCQKGCSEGPGPNQCGCYDYEELSAALSALDAAPEMEPEAFKCLACGHLRYSALHSLAVELNSPACGCDESSEMKPLYGGD